MAVCKQHTKTKLSWLSRNIPISGVISGSMGGMIVVLRTVSYATLIFEPPLSPLLGPGLSAMLLSGAIAQLVSIFCVCRRGGVKGLVVGSSSTATPLLTLLLIRLRADLPQAGGPGETALHPALPFLTFFCLAFTGFLAGLLLYAMGRFRLARYLAYLPQPVSRGFFGAVGILMMVGGLSNASGLRLSLDSIESWSPLASGGPPLQQFFACVVFGLALLLVKRRIRRPILFPIFIMLCLLVFYAGIFAFADLPTARAFGWVYAAAAKEAGVEGASHNSAFSFYSFLASPSVGDGGVQLGNVLRTNFYLLLSAPLFAVFDMTLNLPALQELDDSEKGLDLNQEMKTAGIGSLLAGLAGGAGISYVTLSPTKINHASGGRSQAASIAAMLVNVLVLLLGHEPIFLLPPAFVGGLLFYAGIIYLQEGVVDAWHMMEFKEYIAVWCIVGVAVWVGLMESVGIGTAACSLLFIFKYSSHPFVSSAYELNTMIVSSERVRDAADARALRKHKKCVPVVTFSGYLFFGSVERIAGEARAYLLRRGTRAIIFDFRQVWDVDSSALETMQRLFHLADNKGIQVVLTSLEPPPPRACCPSRCRLKRWFRSAWGACCVGGRQAADKQALERRRRRRINQRLDRAGLLQASGGERRKIFPSLILGKDWCSEQLILRVGGAAPGDAGLGPGQVRVHVSSGGSGGGDGGGEGGESSPSDQVTGGGGSQSELAQFATTAADEVLLLRELMGGEDGGRAAGCVVGRALADWLLQCPVQTFARDEQVWPRAGVVGGHTADDEDEDDDEEEGDRPAWRSTGKGLREAVGGGKSAWPRSASPNTAAGKRKRRGAGGVQGGVLPPPFECVCFILSGEVEVSIRASEPKRIRKDSSMVDDAGTPGGRRRARSSAGGGGRMGGRLEESVFSTRLRRPSSKEDAPAPPRLPVHTASQCLLSFGPHTPPLQLFKAASRTRVAWASAKEIRTLAHADQPAHALLQALVLAEALKIVAVSVEEISNLVSELHTD